VRRHLGIAQMPVSVALAFQTCPHPQANSQPA
jgi:hypothetical protein